MNAELSRIVAGNAPSGAIAAVLGCTQPETRESLRHKLTISIVSHGHGPMLLSLLRGLNSLSELSGVKVIVTLNLHSENLDQGQFEKLELIVLRNRTPKGFAENHNHAFNRCSTAWFAVLNPDLQLQENLFSKLLASAEQDSQIALLAPQVVNSNGQPEDSVRANLTPLAVFRRHFLKNTAEAIPKYKFRWYAGMFFLLRSSAFAAVNGFDDRFFLYCEDYDLCARLHLKSLRIVQDPSVSVIHDAQRHSRTDSRYLWLHLRSLVRVWTSQNMWKIAIQDNTPRRRGTPNW